MPSPHPSPADALALAIIRHAVNAWKKNKAILDLLLRKPEIAVPHWLQNEHDKLLMFFHSEWFNFLFTSSVTRTDQGRMFKALGIPAREGG